MLVVPVYEEQVVVRRRLVLTHELRLTPRTRTHAWTEDVVVRRDVAHVERRQGEGTWKEADDASPRAAPAAGTAPGPSGPASPHPDRTEAP